MLIKLQQFENRLLRSIAEYCKEAALAAFESLGTVKSHNDIKLYDTIQQMSSPLLSAPSGTTRASLTLQEKPTDHLHRWRITTLDDL